MNLEEFLNINRLGLYIEEEKSTLIEVDTNRQWIGETPESVIYKYLTEK